MLKLLMEYLFYLQKMLRRRTSTIPFGYKLAEDPKYLEPIQDELDALDEAKKYLNNCSYREVSTWLHRKTGRKISHVGLRKLCQKSNPQNQNQVSEENVEVQQ